MKLTILISIVFGVTASGQNFDFAPQAASSRSASAQPPEPRMSGSMTAYIDNAIIGSQVRIRFDADFHINAPDRAEFFYGKCGCYRTLPASSPFYDKNSPGPGTGIVTSLNAQEVHLNLEYAPSRRFSVFADIPERAVQVQKAVVVNPALPSPNFSNAGIGDFQAGFKVALVAAEDRAVTFQFRAYSPTGSALSGLGTNHVSVEPGVLYYGRLSPRTTLAGQFALWHPINGAQGLVTSAGTLSFAGDVLNYGLGASFDVASMGRTRITPVVEFVGWSVLDGFRTVNGAPTVDASGNNIVNGKFGIRTSFGRNSIYVGYGHALTHDIWYQQIVRLEYRYAF